MSYTESKIIFEHIDSLRKTGELMLTENRKLRPMTENEYYIFSKYLNTGLNTRLLTEASKKIVKENEYKFYLNAVSNFTGKKITPKTKSALHESVKLTDFRVTTSLLLEDDSVYDKKIKNPETGRTIKVATAIQDKQHPAHDKAKAMVQKAGGSDDEHGDDHGHHDDGLSAKEKAILGAVDVALKKLPGVNVIAGQSEAIYQKMKKNPFDSVKEADGLINKTKAFGKAAKEVMSNWKDEAKTAFANSMTDENTGQRKSIGKLIGSKAKAIGKAIAKGVVDEVKHVAHELKDGADGIKEAFKHPDGLKAGLKDPKIQKKLATGLKGVATAAVVGMAIASGPGGAALKAASLAINPGDGVRAMLTASAYIDLKNRNYLNELHNNRYNAIKLIESKIDKIGDNFIMEVYSEFGSKELNEVESPLKTYSEEDMNKVVKYTQMSDEIMEATKSGKEE